MAFSLKEWLDNPVLNNFLAEGTNLPFLVQHLDSLKPTQFQTVEHSADSFLSPTRRKIMKH